MRTSKGAAQDEGDIARRARRAEVPGAAQPAGARRQGGGGNGGGDGGGGGDDDGGEGSGDDGGKESGGGGGGGGGDDGGEGSGDDGGKDSSGSGGGGDGDEATRASMDGEGGCGEGGPRRVPLGAWLEPHPSGLRVRSGGLSRHSEALDHLQAAGSLSMHRELCAHSPTGAQSAQAIGMPGTPGEQGLWQWQSERQAGQWPGAPSGLQLRSPDSAARQASVAQSHQPFCRRRTSLIHQKSRFFIVAIGKRRLRHRMRLFALMTMVCFDLANSNAFSRNSKSKSGAPWRQGTG